MAKTLIILVLLFDGTLVQERYELGREMPVSECLQYGDDHREAIAEYKEFKDPIKNGWYLNCLLYTSPSPRDVEESRMPSSA